MLNNFPKLDIIIKTIAIPFRMNLKIIKVKNQIILACFIESSKTKYFIVPKCIQIKKVDQNLFFYNAEKAKIVYLTRKFFDELTYECRNLKKTFFKTITIRGVGLKATLIKSPASNSCLELKLGFSHLILLTIPQDLNVTVLKRKIIIAGHNSIQVGNFTDKIQKFKTLNIYTGKGLWLKSKEKIYLKSLNKLKV
jgi:ribosomal protein L6P/L9E